MNITAMRIFDHAVNLIFGILLLFITFGIVIGVIHLFLQLGDMVIDTDITRNYVRIVPDVLTLFVLIELSRSLVSHFSEHRLRLTFIVDAGIVFVLREIMLKGTSKNPNSVAIRRCSKNFNAYISYICGALKFLSRLVSLRILNF